MKRQHASRSYILHVVKLVNS